MSALKPKLPDLERVTRNAIINAEFWRVHTYAHLLPLPDGHKIRDAYRTTKWFLNDELMSTDAGASLMVDKVGADANDPNQLHVEIRLFWPHLQDKDPDYPSHHAIIWAEWGARYFGRQRELLLEGLKLGNHALSVRADGIDQLWRKVRQALTPALGRARQLQLETNTHPVTEGQAQ